MSRYTQPNVMEPLAIEPARGRSTRLRLAAFCLALLPGCALAGGSATLQSQTPEGPARLEVSWSGDNLRMDLPGQAGAYMLVQGEDAYSVARHGGRTMVLDMAQMRQMGQMAGGDPAEALGPGNMVSLDGLEATGEHETIAGITGEVYRIAWTDGSGNRHEDEAVFSGDARARALTAAFGRSTRALTGRAEDPFGEAARGRDLGVLRFADKLEVVAISDDEPPASAFELPAEPMSLQDLMGGAR